MCTYGMAAISSFELFISYTDHIETEMTVLGKGKKNIWYNIYAETGKRLDCSCDTKFYFTVFTLKMKGRWKMCTFPVVQSLQSLFMI